MHLHAVCVRALRLWPLQAWALAVATAQPQRVGTETNHTRLSLTSFQL